MTCGQTHTHIWIAQPADLKINETGTLKQKISQHQKSEKQSQSGWSPFDWCVGFDKRSFSTAAPSVWNFCQHLFWTVTLWHYLKPNLKLIFSRMFLANWLDLSASASEAIAPWRSTNRVLLLFFFFTLVIKDPEGFGNRKNRNWKCKEWHLIRAVIMDKRIMQ